LPRHERVQGSVDDLQRPLIRIETAGFRDPLIAYVDTGFNGALLIDEAQATRFGFRIFKNMHAGVRLASQREETFYLARGIFPWFGERRPTTAYVLIETPEEYRARIARKTEEEILIGTELLSLCRLEIDFPARKVQITKAA
jgi:predicted aspartyl protease